MSIRRSTADLWTLAVRLSHRQSVSVCSVRHESNGRNESRFAGVVNSHPTQRGNAILKDPKNNKGTAFTLEERQVLGIHGLLPPVVFTQEQQARRVMNNVRSWDSKLDQYIYMNALLDRNEKLFFKVVSENIEELAPILYTPTVGQACQKYGFIFRKPRGLFITINDIGHVYELVCNFPEEHIKAVVVTDGERILGLGDLGAFGMGIPCGKLSLYTAMGGIPPQQCLPVVLDVGTNNEKLLNSKTYIGLKHKRINGEKYDQLIEEFLAAIVKRYGQNTLIQFEDFANHNAFRLLEKYRNKYLTFNDDIQGTASVAVAGLMSSMRITKKRLSDNTYLFFGAGEAALGIANLLVSALMEEGTSSKEAYSKIWLIDRGGLLTKNRPTGDIGAEKDLFIKEHEHMTDLEEITKFVKPSVTIGAAGVAGKFTKGFLKEMAANNERPVIFALSNPTALAECTAEDAYTHTEGRCIFASGSPFDPVVYNGKTFYPGQGNNAYIFPGIALGVIAAGCHHISDEMFLMASRDLANMVTQEHLDEGRVYPPLVDIRGIFITPRTTYQVSTQLAVRIVEHAYEKGLAATYPEPVDKEAFVKEHQYSTLYDNYMPNLYKWPE